MKMIVIMIIRSLLLRVSRRHLGPSKWLQR